MKSLDILVVDDIADCRNVLAAMLEGQGYTVRTADCGEAALASIASKRPDVVLLDIMMPGMSGLEVLERVRSTPVTASLPVILLTARSSDDDMVNGYQMGADYYIPKPCTVRQLVHGLSIVVDRGGETRAA